MPTKTIASVGLALILFAIANQANAHTGPVNQPSYDRHDIRGAFAVSAVEIAVPRRVKRTKHYRRHEDRVHRHYAKRDHSRLASSDVKIVAHPEGCPHRAFCGCGTSLRLLGKAVAEGGLAIAKNWLDFPRAACAPNMAAARPGHVFAIIECLSGNRALAYDPNSGGHQTRIHVRDLSRYTIVNPHGSTQYAQAP